MDHSSLSKCAECFMPQNIKKLLTYLIYLPIIKIFLLKYIENIVCLSYNKCVDILF